jgi:AcrR family transcriptional regulator
MVFGTNGYKKASVSDIATAAGISKSMVFHYFGTKKALYFYLIDLCGTIIVNEVNEKFDNSVTDFFDRIMLASEIEISAMKKHPATMSFINSMYFEENDEVKEDIKAVLTQGEDTRGKIAFEGTDFSKFKEGVDITLVMKMLMWLTDGFMNSSKSKVGMDINTLCNEIYECMRLLKNNLYKEEYID